MRALVLLIMLMSIGLSVPARAQEDSVTTSWTLNTTVASRYIDGNLEPLSNRPTAFGYLSFGISDHASCYGFGSAILSTKGRSGLEPYADQVELGCDYNNSWGPIDFEVEAGLAHFVGLGNISKDTFRTQIEASHMFTSNAYEAKLYVRAIYWIGLGTDPNEPIGVIGIAPAYTTGKWKIGADLSVAYDGLEKVTRGDIKLPTVSYAVSDSFTLNGSVDYLIGHDGHEDGRSHKESGLGVQVGLIWSF
jgi:hypothetical protein